MESSRNLALVTGASSGIGAALAERLARDGRDVLIVARRRERLEALAARLQAETGAAVDSLVADLTDPEQLAVVEQRIAREERLDLLVNNAGFAGYGPFAEIDRDVAGRLAAIHGTVAEAASSRLLGGAASALTEGGSLTLKARLREHAPERLPRCLPLPCACRVVAGRRP
jgi:uncharacterized protein